MIKKQDKTKAQQSRKTKNKLIDQNKIERKYNAGIIIFILGLTILLYGNTIYNSFSMDDHHVTCLNSTVREGISSLPEIFTTFYSSVDQMSFGYRPIVKATYAIEYDIFGVRPGISHFINLLLYAFTGIVLYFLLRKLLKNYHLLFPLVIAFLFLIHPIHTEVVASLKNRDEMLSLLFGLLMLNSFVNYSLKPSVKRLIWGLLFFILGILSKPTIGVFMVIVPLIFYFFSDMKPKKILGITGIVLLILLLTILIPLTFLPETNRPIDFYENPLIYEKNIWLRIGTGFYIMLNYLRLLVYPQPLLFYYGYDMVPIVNLANVWVILSIVIYLGIFIIALLNLKKKHIVSFGLLFYLVTMAMYSNILKPAPGIIADRFLLTGSIGFSIVIAWLLFKAIGINITGTKIRKNKSIILVVILAVLLIPSTIATRKRNKDWKDYLSLYESDIKKLDKSVKANILYASALTVELHNTFEREKQDIIIPKIIKHYDRALELWPDNFEVLNNFGSFYYKTYSTYIKDPDKAYKKGIQYLEKASRLEPSHSVPYYNLADAYTRMMEYDKALYYFEKTMSLDPGNIKLKSEAANLYFEAGDVDRAKELNYKMMNEFPASDLPYINLGNYYLKLSDTTGAIAYWERAVQKLPQKKLCIKLSNHFRAEGDMQKAVYYYNLSESTDKIK